MDFILSFMFIVLFLHHQVESTRVSMGLNFERDYSITSLASVPMSSTTTASASVFTEWAPLNEVNGSPSLDCYGVESFDDLTKVFCEMLVDMVYAQGDFTLSAGQWWHRDFASCRISIYAPETTLIKSRTLPFQPMWDSCVSNRRNAQWTDNGGVGQRNLSIWMLGLAVWDNGNSLGK
ncbi:hypothetical protein BX600DRAFT_430125 [Xylariales sp. PMI_506]|nr:hypothetical protein BX600DRAFT_430125 [Xylariales sp. PMI_506]